MNHPRVTATPTIHAQSRWRHRKTQRPAVVIRGNAMQPEVVAGMLFDQPGTTLMFRYTDRLTRVMTRSMTVSRFLETFEARS